MAARFYRVSTPAGKDALLQRLYDVALRLCEGVVDVGDARPNLERAVDWLERLAESRANIGTRLAEVQDAIMALARLEFSFAIEPSKQRDGVDAILIGLRMLREELVGAFDKLHGAHEVIEEKAAELTRVNRELSQYAYIVAHDLKTPLRGIRSCVDFLTDDLRDDLGGEQREYFDALVRAAHHGEELVSDLLDFASIDRERLEFVPIDIGECVERVLTDAAFGEDVVVEQPGEWPHIEANVVLLQQILQNLVVNAAKFNPKPVKHVTLGWRQDNDKAITLFVRDDGIGIEPRHHERIFNIFQRLYERSVYDGTGIGLAIVKKAVDCLGGQVLLESEANRGSTFYVVLPKRQNMEAPA